MPNWDRLPNLTQLNLSGNTSFTTLHRLDSLVRLTKLNLFGCASLVALPGIEHLTQLTVLDLSFCSSLTALIGLEHLTNLESLYLYGCTNLSILNLTNCKNLTLLQGLTTLLQLTKLNFSGCEKLTEVNFFEARHSSVEARLGLHFQLIELDFSGCHTLRMLDLAGLQELTTLQGVETLTQLTHLDLSECRNLTALPGVEALTQLTHLDLSGCRNLTALPGLKKLTHLTKLSCSNSGIQLPREFLFPPNLNELNLSNTQTKVIPDDIQNLNSLSQLYLQFLQLDALPDWLPKIAGGFSTKKNANVWGHEKAYVYLAGTTIEGVDMTIFDRPYEMVVKWFEEHKKGNTEQLNEIKVVFLGDGEVGKSHTIARLLHDGEKPKDFDGQATPGIAIAERIYDLDGRRVQVHFWDFGGQEILHSMHRMFLTKRTLYVVLINGRDNTQNDRARYWLHNVKSFAPEAPVLLALNKIDQNPNASIDESGLRKLYPRLTEVVKMSALNYSQEEFNATFTAAMKRQITVFKILESPFTPAWRRLKDKLHSMTKHYIRSSQYMDFCQDCGVEESETTRKALLEWFNDLGVSFCYSESPKLEDYVILQPQWITNAIYILLYNRIKGNKNGIVSHDDIFNMLKRQNTQADPIHRVLPDVFYTVDEVQYVLNVVRRFRLSYPVAGEKEFFPMLCDREEATIVKDFAGKSDTLEFRMIFEYLPNNVLHRLMVDMHRDLQMNDVWITGAHFVQESNRLSAVVKSDGNSIIIYARGSKQCPAQYYLNTIKDHLEWISQEMGLEIKECQVVYNADGVSEVFNYKMILGTLDKGRDEVYSMTRDDMIPISNILCQTDHEVNKDRKELILDILKTCRNMQKNMLYWNASENDRNTYIRDALNNMCYIVKDQTLAGIALGGKLAGELDLEIQKEHNVTMTILEGLNLCGFSESRIAYWNDHLKKLLDNYNPIGLPFLIMTSYVPCHKDKFVKICNSFTNYIEKHSPERYSVIGAKPVSTASGHTEETNFLQMVKCRYDCGGAVTTVYHIFVRLGDEAQ